MHAAQKRPVVDVAPWQHALEALAQRQLPDAQAHLIVANGLLGTVVEGEVAEMGVGVEAARSFGFTPGTKSKHALPASQMRSRYVPLRTPNFDTPAPTSAAFLMTLLHLHGYDLGLPRRLRGPHEREKLLSASHATTRRDQAPI